MSPIRFHDNDRFSVQLAKHQYLRCHWCNRLCEINRTSWQFSFSFTVDHVIPRSRGGADNSDNIVGACFRCNNVRDQIEKCMQGYGDWPDVPKELFIKLLPTDIFWWRINPGGSQTLNKVLDRL